MIRHDFRPLAVEAARAAADKKAVDILVLDIRQASDVADYMVIAGVESSAQMRAVESAVEEALDRKSIVPLRRDGRQNGRWIAVDYGGLVLHILLPQAREFYRLEQLWEGARHVAWDNHSHAPSKLHRKKIKS